LLKKYAEEHNVSFIEKDIKNAAHEETEWAGMLPIIFFWDERVEFEEAFKRITEGK
jgi:hypothetical protein